MTRYVASLAATCAITIACGSTGEPLDGTDVGIAFQTHALQCDIVDLKARLQIDAATCPLDVDAATHVVTGLCRKVPTGNLVNFRLVYFVLLGGRDVCLATAIKQLDLTNETREEITLQFSTRDLMTSIDFDADGATNIDEVCNGRNPLVQDH